MPIKLTDMLVLDVECVPAPTVRELRLLLDGVCHERRPIADPRWHARFYIPRHALVRLELYNQDGQKTSQAAFTAHDVPDVMDAEEFKIHNRCRFWYESRTAA
jgi:hypothetical protein